MQSDEINKILKKHKKVFDALEQYDKTGKLIYKGKRIDVDKSVETI
jgi:hypothetical protein